MAKRGLIDVYKTRDLYSGLGQFSYHLARQLLLENNGIDYDFLLPGPEAEKMFQLSGNHKFAYATVQKRYFPGFNPDYTFWHSTQQFPSFFPNKRTPLILTIHDLNFLSSKSLAKAEKYRKRLQKNIDRAEVITTISHFTKSEIEKHLNLKGKEIRVVYNGIPDHRLSPGVRPVWAGSTPFFLSVGVFKSTKNFHSLLPLMKYFPDYRLIIAGNNNTAYGKEIQEGIAQLGLQGKVILPGTISEDEKQWLYAHCSAFLFPSLAEGFGMPVAEAMKAGCPVFSSALTSLPEIGGDTVYYFDAFEEQEMKNVITNGLHDFNNNLIIRKEAMAKKAAKFNWEVCARAYSAIYREMSGR